MLTICSCFPTNSQRLDTLARVVSTHFGHTSIIQIVCNLLEIFVGQGRSEMYRFSKYAGGKLDAGKRIKVDKRPRTRPLELHSSSGLTRGGLLPINHFTGSKHIVRHCVGTERCVFRVYLFSPGDSRTSGQLPTNHVEQNMTKVCTNYFKYNPPASDQARVYACTYLFHDEQIVRLVSCSRFYCRRKKPCLVGQYDCTRTIGRARL